MGLLLTGCGQGGGNVDPVAGPSMASPSAATSAAPAAPVTPSASALPTAPSPTPTVTPVPYNPKTDYSDATLANMREYVRENDSLIQADLPQFEAQMAPIASGSKAASLVRQAQAVVKKAASIPKDGVGLHALLGEQEQVLADMATLAGG